MGVEQKGAFGWIEVRVWLEVGVLAVWTRFWNGVVVLGVA